MGWSSWIKIYIGDLYEQVFYSCSGGFCIFASGNGQKSSENIVLLKEDDTRKTACAFFLFTADNYKEYGSLTLNPWWSSSWDATRGITVKKKAHFMDWLLGEATYETKEQGATGYGPEPLFSVIIAKKHLMTSGSFDVSISNRGIAGATFKCKAVVK